MLKGSLCRLPRQGKISQEICQAFKIDMNEKRRKQRPSYASSQPFSPKGLAKGLKPSKLCDDCVLTVQALVKIAFCNDDGPWG